MLKVKFDYERLLKGHKAYKKDESPVTWISGYEHRKIGWPMEALLVFKDENGILFETDIHGKGKTSVDYNLVMEAEVEEGIWHMNVYVPKESSKHYPPGNSILYPTREQALKYKDSSQQYLTTVTVDLTFLDKDSGCEVCGL